MNYSQKLDDETDDETIVRGHRQTRTQASVARIQLESGISFSVQEANLPLSIGRAADCDICIPSGMVSRRHCELFLLNGVLCLKDTSSNGTMIDQRVVKQGSVSIQDETSVTFAGEVGIKITPCNTRSTQPAVDRRKRDRRQRDRRQQVVVVDFERRKASNDRRTGDRRTSDKRTSDKRD